MATSIADVLLQVQRWTSPRLADSSDAVLLERFVQGREEAAFAELVARHGAMVLRSCRRVLGDVQASEDAFQATFLILARKAHTLRQTGALPGFLHSVARRVALKARTQSVRVSQTPLPETLSDPRADPLARLTARELLTVLDEEVQRLPSAQRSAVVLCCLEGHAQEEAARMLGWTAGSLKGHLERGRRRLQARLTRRGIALPAALAVVAVSRGEAAPALLLRSTITAALNGGISDAAAVLAHGVLKTMWRGKLAGMAAVVLTVAFVASATVACVYRGAATEAPEDKAPAAPDSTKNTEPSKPTVRTDALGDPLPPQAVARLGSRRLNHGSSVYHVVLSSDGKWVVSSSWDGNRLWDTASGRELPFRKELKLAAIFATRDKLVAVAKEKLDLQLWDVMSGKKIGGLLPAAKVGDLALEIHLGRHYGYSPLGISPDGRTLVICNRGLGKRLALRFCDIVRGQVEPPINLKVDVDESIAPARMVFSADGKTLVLHCIGKGYSAVHIWDVARRKEQIVSRSSLTDYGGQIALSPDGRILVTVPFRVRLWDTGTLKELLPLFEAPKEDLIVIAISPDGKKLAVSNRGSSVRLLDLATRKEVRQFQGKGSTIYHMAFSADGKYLVAGDGGNVTFWDVTTGKYRHDFWHTNRINSVAFSPDGKRLVSCADSIVRVWDPLTGKETSHLHGHKNQVAVVAYSPDGKLIASGGQDTAIRLWDTATGREIRRLETEDGYFDTIVFVSDGKTLASVGGRHLKLVHRWDVATGRKLRTFKIPYALAIFSPDGKTLATHGYQREDTDIQLWDVAKGEPIHRLAGPKANPPKLVFSPDGKTLAASSIDGSVHLWDALSGEERRTLADPLGVHGGGSAESIAFSPDGRSLAAGYGFFSGQEEEGCMVRLWELSSGHVRLRYDRQGSVSHRRGIQSLAFSPDSTLLATGGEDHMILVWDLTGQRTTHPPRKSRLRPEEVNALWSELADTDAHVAYRAMQTLFAAGEQAVSLFKKRLRPASAIDERQIDQRIADLDNDRFDVREKAERELREMGEDAEPALRKLLAGKPSAEQRRRVNQLLQKIPPERLRRLRAVEVLEWLGTKEAREALEVLAAGAPGARLTEQARAALQRRRLPN